MELLLESRTETELFSSSQWLLPSTPFRTSSLSSLMRGQFSSEKSTTTCTLSLHTSLERLLLSSQLASLLQPFSVPSYTTQSVFQLRLLTSSLFSVITLKLIYLVGILILLYSAAGSYALIISTMFADKQLAVTLTPVLIIPFMLFAGFFVNQDNIPIWLIEFQYMSFFKYGY